MLSGVVDNPVASDDGAGVGRSGRRPQWARLDTSRLMAEDLIDEYRLRDTVDGLRAAFASSMGSATAADAAHLQQLAPVRRMIFTVEEA